MTKKLFIGGLAYSVTDTELTEHFSQAGTVVSANVIMDRASGQSKGFGFVEMSTEEEALNALKTLEATELSGRRINVKEAKPQEDRSNSGSQSRGGGRDNWNKPDRDFNRNSRSSRR
jgi:RNA recognition motif-containing protein